MMKKINVLNKKIKNKFNQLDKSLSPNFIKIIKFLRNILFYLGLTGILLYESAHYSSLIIMSYSTGKILGSISLLLLVIKILLSKEKLWKYILFTILIYLAYICEQKVGIGFHMTFIIVPMIASRGMDIKKIVKYIFCFNFLLIILQIFCYIMFKIGIMDFLTIEDEIILYRNNHIRHTFFFFHPNTFSNYLFWTYMMFVYLNFDNKKLRKIIVLIALLLAVFVYTFPVSRNASIFFIISIPLLYIFDNKKIQQNNLFCSLNEIFIVLCMSVSFLLLIFYNENGLLGDFSSFVDKLLSGRIWLGSSYLVEYGTSFLGNYMNEVRNFNAAGVTTFVVDNWYFYMLIRLGLVFTFFNFIMLFKGSINFVKNNDFSKMYVLIIFILYNCIEIIGTIPQLSFIYFFLGMLF